MNKGSLGKNWEIINIGSVVNCACFLGSSNYIFNVFGDDLWQIFGKINCV
jgi:hypothetical protein